MKFINSFATLFVFFLCTDLAYSYENFINTISPYPAGCITYANIQNDIYPDSTQQLYVNDEVLEGNILIEGFTPGTHLEAKISLYRTGCAEDNRSVLLARLEIVDNENGVVELGIIHEFEARIGTDDYPLRPTTEPNSWVDDGSLTTLPEGAAKTFVLDIPTPLSPRWVEDAVLTPSLYNGEFLLLLRMPSSTLYSQIRVSAYDNELQPSVLPFNGRLSGVWIVEGAPDQGFLISFSELPGNTEQGLIFFSWYTFDQNGENLWLVGNTQYAIGNDTTFFELQLVTDGEFLGGKTASRLPAGNVRISAKNCNLLELEFDLREIGLGQSVVPVSRIFGIETAGYTCMDLEDRLN